MAKVKKPRVTRYDRAEMFLIKHAPLNTSAIVDAPLVLREYMKMAFLFGYDAGKRFEKSKTQAKVKRG